MLCITLLMYRLLEPYVYTVNASGTLIITELVSVVLYIVCQQKLKIQYSEDKLKFNTIPSNAQLYKTIYLSCEIMKGKIPRHT